MNCIISFNRKTNTILKNKCVLLFILIFHFSLAIQAQFKCSFREKSYERKFNSITKLISSNNYKIYFEGVSQFKNFERQIIQSKKNENIVDFYRNSASFFLRDYNFDKTHYYIKNGLHYAKKGNDYVAMGKLYETLGVAYSLNLDTKKSDQMIFLSEKYLTKYASIEDQKDLNYNLNRINYRKKDWNKVLKYGLRHDSILKITNEISSPIVLASISEAYLYFNNLKNAFSYLTKIEKLPFSKRNQSFVKKAYYNAYGKYLYKIGQYKGSSIMFHKSINSNTKDESELSKKMIKSLIKEQKMQLLTFEFDKIKNENIRARQNLANKNLLIILSFLIIITMLVIITMQRQNSKFKSKTNRILENTNSELEKALEVKNNFLNIISHEFRTPLNATMNALYLIKTKEKLNTNFEIIEKSITNLHKLTSQIFEYHFLNQKNFKILIEDKIQINKFIHNIIAEFNVIYRNKNKVEINVDDAISKVLYFDSEKLSMLLNIIIDNAFKFTKEGLIIIDLKLIHSNAESQKIDFMITDTGIGFSEDKNNKIRNLFEQGSDKTHLEYGGSGIGLALADKIANLYHSQLNVKSVLGQGTTVSFELDLKRSSNNEDIDSSKSIEKKSKEQVKILLVDDNQINILLTKKILKSNGYSCLIAYNGEEAVDIVSKNDISIIFMDIMMPIMDGFQASTIISELKKEIPIIALTAISEEINKEKFTNSKIKKVLNKPLNVNELLKTIHQYSI
jgi:signal transduction histidine kinase/CheY-like chemotaxis protein